MIKAITSRMSALMLATIGVTLAGTIFSFGASLVVLALLQTVNSSSYASVDKTPLRFVSWMASPAAGRVQNP